MAMVMATSMARAMALARAMAVARATARTTARARATVVARAMVMETAVAMATARATDIAKAVARAMVMATAVAKAKTRSMTERNLNRFYSKTRDGNGLCLEWTGRLNGSGYGVFVIGHAKGYLAHRALYEHHKRWKHITKQKGQWVREEFK